MKDFENFVSISSILIIVGEILWELSGMRCVRVREIVGNTRFWERHEIEWLFNLSLERTVLVFNIIS